MESFDKAVMVLVCVGILTIGFIARGCQTEVEGPAAARREAFKLECVRSGGSLVGDACLRCK